MAEGGGGGERGGGSGGGRHLQLMVGRQRLTLAEKGMGENDEVGE